MKVVALRTVYNKAESKEYQKGQTFEVDERAGRVMLKLRKVEPADKAAAKRAAPRQDAVLTAAMKATPAPPTPAPDTAQHYRRRDLKAQD